MLNGTPAKNHLLRVETIKPWRLIMDTDLHIQLYIMKVIYGNSTIMLYGVTSSLLLCAYLHTLSNIIGMLTVLESSFTKKQCRIIFILPHKTHRYYLTGFIILYSLSLP